jgi:cytoskeletal protein CcmA (bactofilin family)
MTDVHINTVDEEVLDTILASDVEFHGKLAFKKPLMIKGKFSGSIDSSSDLYVDEKAVVTADIRVANLSLKGRVKGNVVADNRVELFATCVLEGDVSAPEVTMETGCRFTGICTTTRKKADEASS